MNTKERQQNGRKWRLSLLYRFFKFLFVYRESSVATNISSLCIPYWSVSLESWVGRCAKLPCIQTQKVKWQKATRVPNIHGKTPKFWKCILWCCRVICIMLLAFASFLQSLLSFYEALYTELRLFSIIFSMYYL